MPVAIKDEKSFVLAVTNYKKEVKKEKYQPLEVLLAKIAEKK